MSRQCAYVIQTFAYELIPNLFQNYIVLKKNKMFYVGIAKTALISRYLHHELIYFNLLANITYKYSRQPGYNYSSIEVGNVICYIQI